MRDQKKRDQVPPPDLDKVSPNSYVDTETAASFIDSSRKTMEGWRFSGKGPPYIRVSPKMIRYKVKDLIDFLESRRRISTSDESRSREDAADKE